MSLTLISPRGLLRQLMKRSPKADPADVLQSGASPGTPAKRSIRKRSKKRARNRKKFAEAGSGIRETEEARALLEDQLSSLYWWTFHAFRMKGFIRAKGLYEAAERWSDGNDDAQKTSTGALRPIVRKKARRRSKK
jgi:hypothetical protein